MDTRIRHVDPARPPRVPTDAHVRPLRGAGPVPLLQDARPGPLEPEREPSRHEVGDVGTDAPSTTMTRAAFEALVREAMRAIPRQFRDRMKNVEIVVEDSPSPALLAEMGHEPGDTLFGLYHGTPLTERGWAHGNALPDRIVLYQRPLEAECEDEDELFEEVCLTLIHEAGHYFGLSEEEIDEAEEIWWNSSEDPEDEPGGDRT
jgi:predicted Zn-dependent protease with MMP-like domain